MCLSSGIRLGMSKNLGVIASSADPGVSGWSEQEETDGISLFLWRDAQLSCSSKFTFVKHPISSGH